MLETTKEVKDFISTEHEGLCGDHVVSQWVVANWDKIATECYITTKARNALNLLGLNNIPDENPEFYRMKGIVYETGRHIIDQKLRTGGYIKVSELNKNHINKRARLVTEKIKLENNTISLGEGITEGKIIEYNGELLLMPKRHRTRALRLYYDDYIKIEN